MFIFLWPERCRGIASGLERFIYKILLSVLSEDGDEVV